MSSCGYTSNVTAPYRSDLSLLISDIGALSLRVSVTCNHGIINDFVRRVYVRIRADDRCRVSLSWWCVDVCWFMQGVMIIGTDIEYTVHEMGPAANTTVTQ